MAKGPDSRGDTVLHQQRPLILLIVFSETEKWQENYKEFSSVAN